jgi:hypothetical protein
VAPLFLLVGLKSVEISKILSSLLIFSFAVNGVAAANDLETPGDVAIPFKYRISFFWLQLPALGKR